MGLLDMAQTNSFSDEIDCEATEVQTSTHLQKSNPAKGISLKATGNYIAHSWLSPWLAEAPLTALERKTLVCTPLLLAKFFVIRPADLILLTF